MCGDCQLNRRTGFISRTKAPLSHREIQPFHPYPQLALLLRTFLIRRMSLSDLTDKTMDNEKLQDLSDDFSRLATQYYVAGRFTIQSGLLPVGANLLHHAIEMYLKAYLCKTVGIDELRDKISHSLTKAWDRFKLILGDASMTRFDSVIEELNQFENLRYPDKASPRGATIIWSPNSEKVFIETKDSRTVQYRLVLGDIDELVEVVLGAIGINPQFLKARLSEDSIGILNRDNPATIWK